MTPCSLSAIIACRPKSLLAVYEHVYSPNGSKKQTMRMTDRQTETDKE